MSEQELNELKQKLEEMNDNLKAAQKAQAGAEEEAKKAKEAQATAEKSKSEIEETLKAIRERVSEVNGGDTSPSMRKKYGPIVFYFFIGVVILFILYIVFSRGTVLKELRDVAYARGLITFIFSLGTIGIGVILTIAALEKGQDAGAAFTRGKEIFTILVGILGTIVGFYFGSSLETRETRAIVPP